MDVRAVGKGFLYKIFVLVICLTVNTNILQLTSYHDVWTVV